MNKILTYGFVVVGLAALFWACGDGPVSGFTPEDQLVEYAYEDTDALTEMVNRAAFDYCDADLNPDACIAATRPDGGSESRPSSSEPATSSSVVRSSSAFNPFTVQSSSVFNPFNAPSSSSFTPFSMAYSSSSSSPGIIPIYSSSHSSSSLARLSSNGRRSSSSAKPASSSVNPNLTTLPEDVPWGTCKANAGKPGSRGVPLKWQFTMDNTLFNGNVRAMLNSSFEWEFDDAEPSSYSGTGSAGLNSTPVTYAESGKFAARATMTYNGQSQKVECDSVEVLGYPISDCECVPDKDEVDVAAESVASGATLVKWTVSKCESEDKTFTYEWEEGMTADGASASMTLDEKITYKPQVTVRNSDNGVLKVSCDPVNTIDSDHPEFEFKEQNAEIELPAGESTVYFNMPQNWHNGDAGNCTFSCNKIGNDQITVTLGSFTPVTNYYVEIKVPISSTIGMTPMKLTLSGPAKCKVGW